MAINFKDYVASVPNFPEEGVTFRDISPLMSDGEAYAAATDKIVEYAKSKGVEMIVGPEARGFIVGCPVAYKLGVGFAPAVKKGSYHAKPSQQVTAWNTANQHYTCTKTRSNPVKKCWSQMIYSQQAAQSPQPSKWLKN